jgi:hypothetical protein
MIVRECHNGGRVSAPSGLMLFKRISVEDMIMYVIMKDLSCLKFGSSTLSPPPSVGLKTKFVP